MEGMRYVAWCRAVLLPSFEALIYPEPTRSLLLYDDT